MPFISEPLGVIFLFRFLWMHFSLRTLTKWDALARDSLASTLLNLISESFVLSLNELADKRCHVADSSEPMIVSKKIILDTTVPSKVLYS